jgi:hypothetical protein
MDHPLQCRCGAVRGVVTQPPSANRAVCYCRDCQAFAHFLGRTDDVLDANGGTDIIQTLPASVTITQGSGELAAMRLSDKGLVRWYAKCCSTPIGNTMADYRISFVGLVHNCLESPGSSLDRSFGPIRMVSFPKRAKVKVRSTPLGITVGMLRLLTMMAGARMSGAYRRTPFYSKDTGAPIVTPKILSADEREAVFKNIQ